MRWICILFMSVFFGPVYSQDYCKRIKTEISDDKTLFDYSSPFDPQNIPPVRVIRKYSTDPDAGFDNFSIIFQIPGNLDDIYTKSADGAQVEKEEKSLVVEFDDKTKLTDDAIAVSHDVTDDHMQSLRVVYYPLTDANIKDLTSKKIARFTLAGVAQVIPADSAVAIQHYIQCIKAMK